MLEKYFNKIDLDCDKKKYSRNIDSSSLKKTPFLIVFFIYIKHTRVKIKTKK